MVEVKHMKPLWLVVMVPHTLESEMVGFHRLWVEVGVGFHMELAVGVGENGSKPVVVVSGSKLEVGKAMHVWLVVVAGMAMVAAYNV